MTVHLVSERWSGRRSSESQTEREVARHFDVIASVPVSGDVLNEIRSHASVPKVGNAHPRISGYYCQGVDIDENGGPTLWKAMARYSTTVIGDVTDPLSEPPVPGWESEVVQREIDTDLDGEPISSSAGEPLDPPLVEEEADPVLVWTKNFATSTVTGTWLASWANKTNSSSETINGESCAVGELLQLGVPPAEFVPGRDGVSAYFKVTFRIAMRLGQGADAWKRSLLDQGYRALNGSDELVMIVDAAGKPLNQPSLLDGTGHRLDPSDPPEFLTFRTKGTRSYDELDLV